MFTLYRENIKSASKILRAHGLLNPKQAIGGQQRIVLEVKNLMFGGLSDISVTLIKSI